MSLSVRRFVLCALVAALSLANAALAAAATLHLRREGRRLELDATPPLGVAEEELRILSSRNRRVAKHSDVSPLAPKAARRLDRPERTRPGFRSSTWNSLPG
jgi:hypothetical protein